MRNFGKTKNTFHQNSRCGNGELYFHSVSNIFVNVATKRVFGRYIPKIFYKDSNLSKFCYTGILFSVQIRKVCLEADREFFSRDSDLSNRHFTKGGFKVVGRNRRLFIKIDYKLYYSIPDLSHLLVSTNSAISTSLVYEAFAYSRNFIPGG